LNCEIEKKNQFNKKTQKNKIIRTKFKKNIYHKLGLKDKIENKYFFLKANNKKSKSK
jgi:hypothetical protein